MFNTIIQWSNLSSGGLWSAPADIPATIQMTSDRNQQNKRKTTTFSKWNVGKNTYSDGALKCCKVMLNKLFLLQHIQSATPARSLSLDITNLCWKPTVPLCSTSTSSCLETLRASLQMTLKKRRRRWTAATLRLLWRPTATSRYSVSLTNAGVDVEPPPISRTYSQAFPHLTN